ncbi:lysine--tRNA ligase [Chlamydiota bacterium]
MSDNEQIEIRKECIKRLKKKGICVFGKKFDKTHSLADCISVYKEGKHVSTAGRVIALRGHGKMIFVDLQDISGRLQLFIGKKQIGEEDFALFNEVAIGDIIGVCGKLFKTKTDEITLMVEQFCFLTKSMRPLPEKWHGLRDIEIRYRRRSVDLMSNRYVTDLFITRAKIITEIRSFLEKRGYLEVETPMMQQIPGGATAEPFVTHHHALDIDLFLRVAPELFLKRLLVGGFEKIFEINRNFRNEGLSRYHNPEFTMMELYSAFDDYTNMMELTEEIIVHLCDKIVGTRKMKLSSTTEVTMDPPWQRLSYRDALKKFVGDELRDTKSIQQKIKELSIDCSQLQTPEEMLDAIFKRAVEPHLAGPVFIIDYPASSAPLAKRSERDSSLVERFELFINGHEIANAYSELNDPTEQRERFLEQSKSTGKEVDEDFLIALEYGMPCAGGLGIGIDRLVMVLTGATSIRDVIFFPQLRPQKK